MPTADKEPPIFYVKNYQFGSAEQDEDSWDDDDDWGGDLLAKYADVLAKDKEVSAEDVALEKLNEVPKDDKDIIAVIRDWVNVIVSDMGICPFSKNADAAGLPGECVGSWAPLRFTVRAACHQLTNDCCNVTCLSQSAPFITRSRG